MGDINMKKLVRSKTPSSVPTHAYMFKGYLNNAINMFDNCRKWGVLRHANGNCA